ncbi:MAG: tetratricopeptide repeat protein [Planctomycetota bacterium]
MNRTDLFQSVRERLDEELDAIIEGGDTNRIEPLAREVAQNPRYADLRYRLAHLYYLRGDYSAALGELDQAIAINANFTDALHLKANILANQGNVEGALSVYQKLLKSEENAEAFYRAAVILGRLGRHEEAIKHARQCVERHRDHQMAHVFLGEQYIICKQWDDAIRHYEIANRVRPYEDYCYILAVLHLRAERMSDGEEYLEEALRLKPNHLNSCVRLAVIKVVEGDYERAYNLLRLALEFYPSYPDLRYSLAKVCLLLGRREEAYGLMQAALEINPRYAEVRREMGYLYSARQMNREAVDELEHSIAINPDDEQAYLNLGFVHSNQGDHERAIDVMEQAIKRFPDSWRLYHNLGIVHLQDKAFPKAKVSFLQAIKINPELESIQRSLRIVFQDESLLEDERERLIRIYHAAEQQPELDHHLGLVYLDFHKEKTAVHYLQRSLSSGYQVELNSILLATVHANMQEFDAAIRAIADFTMTGLAEKSWQAGSCRGCSMPTSAITNWHRGIINS